MKNKAILKEYIVTYKCSTSKSGESQTDSWRKKYLGLIGVLYIIKSVHKQYFQWNPIIDSEVVFSKGMVSSNDDYEIKDQTFFFLSFFLFQSTAQKDNLPD